MSTSNGGKLKEVVFRRGARIFSEGEPGDTTFIIAAGEVDIVKRGADGQENRLVRLTSGQIFGELALVLRKPRAASAVAATDTVCFAIDRDALNARLARCNPFINALFRVICGNLKSITSCGFKTQATDIETLAREGEAHDAPN